MSSVPTLSDLHTLFSGPHSRKINRSAKEISRRLVRELSDKVDIRRIIRDEFPKVLKTIMNEGTPVSKGAQLATADCVGGLAFAPFFDLVLPLIFGSIPVPGIPEIGLLIAHAAKAVVLQTLVQHMSMNLDFQNMLYMRYKYVTIEVENDR